MHISTLIASNYFLFFIGFLGMISHFLKKYQRNQLNTQVAGNVNPLTACLRYYFKHDIINTLLTGIAYTVVFFILYQLQTTDIFSVFSAGYMADSIFNKAEEKGLTVSK